MFAECRRHIQHCRLVLRLLVPYPGDALCNSDNWNLAKATLLCISNGMYVRMAVLNFKIQDELYTLRKHCFLPEWLSATEEHWKELREYGFSESSPISLAAEIMEYSYKNTPQMTLTILSELCTKYNLPLPGNWEDCEKAVKEQVAIHLGCFSDRNMFGDIGQPEYWTDHRKLFLFLGLLTKIDRQTHDNMGGKPWADMIWDHSGLRARQLVNVYNEILSCPYTDEDWQEWPFSIDAEMNS